MAILANPFSGSGPTARRVAELQAALGRHGLEPRVIWGAAGRSALLHDLQRLRACRCVVAAGGDGTIAAVINEMSAGVPLATLPAGNENLFAREFGFVADAASLASSIVAGRTRQIDLGRADGRFFSLMLSVGFDADVAHRVARWREAAGRGRTGSASGTLRRVRRLSYAKPILDSLRSYGYQPLELEADGVRVRGTHALVFNLPQYAFQLPFTPHASADDGLLDWLVFEHSGFHHLASYFVSLVRSKHLGRRDVRHGRARRVRITSAVPLPVQVDGEAAGMTPVDVQVAPRALTVLVP